MVRSAVRLPAALGAAVSARWPCPGDVAAAAANRVRPRCHPGWSGPCSSETTIPSALSSGNW